MKITDEGSQLSIEDVAAFEARHNILLPEEYREFLLRNNGGVPYPNSCKTISGADVVVARFLSIHAASNIDNLDQRCWSSAWPSDDNLKMIQIGYDIGAQELMLGVQGTHQNEVYLVIGNDAHLCARSFDDFLSKLENREGIPRDDSSELLDRIFGGK